MKAEMFGNVVRQCRLGKGLTQQELSAGICSISTLSRIENGENCPTKKVFTLLVEKMGEDGICYDDYLGDYEYEVYSLINKVLICLERRDIRRADNYLNKLRYVVGDGETIGQKGDNLYKFTELMASCVEWYEKDDIEEDVVISQYGYYLYEELDALMQSCIELDYNRGNDSLDKLEIRMHNLMGYAKFLQKDYREAIDIWMRLISSYSDKDYEGFHFVKEKASLYCNISVALTELGMYDEAELLFEKALRLCFDGGGLRLVHRMLHNRMYCLTLKGDKNKAYIDLAFSKAISTCCKKDMLKEEKLKRLPDFPYLIQIF